jgi:hypothetical protein
MISDMDYLKKIAFDKEAVNEQSSGNCRNDVFIPKGYSVKDNRRVILNENKLQSIYK